MWKARSRQTHQNISRLLGCLIFFQPNAIHTSTFNHSIAAFEAANGNISSSFNSVFCLALRTFTINFFASSFPISGQPSQILPPEPQALKLLPLPSGHFKQELETVPATIMAVIDDIPGLEAWVCVNGKRATEYDPDDEVEEVKPPTTTKYIESISGANFTIHFKANHSYQWGSEKYVLGIHWKVDGNTPRGWYAMSSSEEFSIDGRRSSDAQGRKINENFQFGDIKTVETLEKARIAEDRTIASKLGVIQIEVKRKIAERMEVVKQKPQYRRAIAGSSSNKASNTPSTLESKTSNQTLEIAEKAIKGRAISNLVRFVVNSLCFHICLFPFLPMTKQMLITSKRQFRTGSNCPKPSSETSNRPRSSSEIF